jgi:uncharacterized membrane protein YfcA
MAAYVLLVIAAFCAGMMNAIAGGGSFLTFPALVFMGVPSIVANASSSVALFPGAIASAWAFRHDFTSFPGVSFKSVLVVALIGGALGALLLLYTPQRMFDVIVPWLLLASTLVFILAPHLTPALRHAFRIRPVPFLTAHLLIGIYAGYFGGALGLITLAVWNLFGLTDIKAVNPNKILLGGLTNTTAVACFIIAGKVAWFPSLIMLGGAVTGGYVGARLSRKLPSAVVRGAVIAISVVVTIVFFLRDS